MTSSSFLESEAMNQLQQEISSRDVEEQLKEKEDKQPEDQVKRQKKAISEEVVEVPTDSISSPTLSSESLIIPSSIIFLGSSSSSPIPLSLADPRISDFSFFPSGTYSIFIPLLPPCPLCSRGFTTALFLYKTMGPLQRF